MTMSFTKVKKLLQFIKIESLRRRWLPTREPKIYRIIIPTPLKGNEWNPSLEFVVSGIKDCLAQNPAMQDEEVANVFSNKDQVVPVSAISQIRAFLSEDYPANGDIDAWSAWAKQHKISGVEIVEESVW